MSTFAICRGSSGWLRAGAIVERQSTSAAMHDRSYVLGSGRFGHRARGEVGRRAGGNGQRRRYVPAGERRVLRAARAWKRDRRSARQRLQAARHVPCGHAKSSERRHAAREPRFPDARRLSRALAACAHSTPCLAMSKSSAPMVFSCASCSRRPRGPKVTAHWPRPGCCQTCSPGSPIMFGGTLSCSWSAPPTPDSSTAAAAYC